MASEALVYEDFECTLETLQETLERHGVAVLPGALNEDEIAQMRAGMWSMLGTITKNFSKPITQEPSTWGQYMALHPMRHSMLHDFHVGQSQVAWDVRQNPRVAGAFAKLWGAPTEEMITSTDGMSIHFPPERIAQAAREEASARLAQTQREGEEGAAAATAAGEGKGKESVEVDEDEDDFDPVDPGGALANSYYRGDWFHVDQAPGRPQFECVQGLVTAYDANDGDGTLAVLRGSNRFFGDFAKEFKLTTRTDYDWYSIREGDEMDYFTSRGCTRVNVRARAGSLVLWDSRTVHCGCHPQRRRADPKIRFVVYVCMKPLPSERRERTRVIAKKKMLLTNRATSSHWPDGRVTFEGYQTQTVDGIEFGVLPTATLTPLGRLLAGDRPEEECEEKSGGLAKLCLIS